MMTFWLSQEFDGANPVRVYEYSNNLGSNHARRHVPAMRELWRRLSGARHFAGRCQQLCGQSVLSHSDENGCWPQYVYGVQTYRPTQDYVRKDCPIYRQRDNIVELLVGCTGRASIERWHIYAEVRFD